MFRSRFFPLAISIALGIAGATCAPAATLPPPGSSTTPVASPTTPLPPDVLDDRAALAALRLELAEHRKVQIERLRAYRMRGVFPRNRVVPRKANIFIDESGTLCAVANLVWQDGLGDAVAQASRENNFVRVAELDSGPLHDWMLTSGLTREEIAVIQAPYAPMPIDREVSWDAAEDKRLVDHFVAVEKRLVDDTDRSLAIAVSRLRSERAVARRMEFATPPVAAR